MTSQKTTRDTGVFGGSSWKIWGITLFGRGEAGVLDLIRKELALGKKNWWIATVNPEFVMEASKDAEFKALLNRTSLNVVDGIGLVWARKVMAEKTVWKRLWTGFWVGLGVLAGRYADELAAGASLMDKMCALAENKQKTVYFLGGWGDRSRRTAEYFTKKYPKLIVAGYQAEDFDFEVKTDFLFVALGMKKQEEWIDRNLAKLKAGIVMGVGRSFDYYSGDLKRTPKWVNRIGLEWLYSLWKEPKRLKRQLVLPQFVWKVVVGK